MLSECRSKENLPSEGNVNQVVEKSIYPTVNGKITIDAHFTLGPAEDF